MTNRAQTDQKISQRNWKLLALFLVLGGVLRILFVGSFHVEHFDEGVYASNRWFSVEEGTRYPERHLYAPPLWPAVLEYSQLVFGPTSLGVMLPGILCGTLAIGLLWRLLGCWTGPDEALLVAGLLALSGFHILFSCTALTDAPVTMLMVAGIGLGWSSLSRANWRMAVAAGVVTGLAWLVKYNGWFPLAVTGAGLAAANVFHVKQTRVLIKSWGCWLLMVLTAAIVWSPAWWDLQVSGRGGYAAVAANHAGYLTGWSHWLEQLRLQFENLAWFDDGGLLVAVSGLLVGFLVVYPWLARVRQGSVAAGTSRKTVLVHLILVAVLILVPWMFGLGFSLPRLWLSLAVFGLGIRLLHLLRASLAGEPVTPQILSGWMALAWLTSLVLTTPLYRPFPRLALPLYFALLVGTAFGIQELKRLVRGMLGGSVREADTEGSETPTGVSRGTGYRLLGGLTLSLLLCHVVVGPRIVPTRDASPWQSRLSMEEAARQLVEICNDRSPERRSSSVAYIVYVYGEPALYYQLCRLAPENVVVGPVANLEFLKAPSGREEVPIYLVTGPHTLRDSNFPAQREQAGDRLVHVTDCQVRVSDLLVLNLHSPREFAESGSSLSEVTIELLEMQPAGESGSP